MARGLGNVFKILISLRYRVFEISRANFIANELNIMVIES